MNISDLQNKFTEASEHYSFAVQTYLGTCACDADTKYALDEISRQMFYALIETQNALIEYLKEK